MYLTVPSYVVSALLSLVLLMGSAAITPASAQLRPCVQHTDCYQQRGETCLNGTCRSANDHRVERLFTVAIAPFYDLTPAGEGTVIAEEAPTLLEGLLRSTVFFETLSPSLSPKTAMLEGWLGSTILFRTWSTVGAYALVKGTIRQTEGAELVLTLRLFIIETGEHVHALDYQAIVREDTLRDELIRWADQVVREFAGRPGILGTRIAFARKDDVSAPKEIYITGLDGIEEVPVTQNGSLNMFPSWGPLGLNVAYTSYIDRNPDVYLNGQKFSGFPNLNMGAEWSPDRREVALSLSKDGNSEIYVLDGSTGAVKRRITNHPGIDSSPSWSPDGKEIVFVSDRTGNPQLYITDSRGQHVRRLSTGRNYCTSPAWSPVGDLIAYNAMVAGGKFHIYLIDAKTGRQRQLTHGKGSHEDPSWSPDARYLVFSSTRDSTRKKKRRQLYIVSANGGRASRLTRREALYYTPSWSPR